METLSIRSRDACGSCSIWVISRLNLKDFIRLHGAEVYMELHAVPCRSMRLHAVPCGSCSIYRYISRLNLKDFHTAPVVFEVYTVAPCALELAAPCGSMRLHAAPRSSRRLHAFLDLIERVSIRLL